MEGRLAAMFVDTDGRQGLEMAAEKGKSGMKNRILSDIVKSGQRDT